MATVLGIRYFNGSRGDRGDTIQTFDQAYAQDLTNELRHLGFKEVKGMPTGAVLASKEYPVLEVLRTSKTIPFGEGSLHHHDAVHLNGCRAAIERRWGIARAHQPHRKGRRQQEQHERYTPPRPGK